MLRKDIISSPESKRYLTNLHNISFLFFMNKMDRDINHVITSTVKSIKDELLRRQIPIKNLTIRDREGLSYSTTTPKLNNLMMFLDPDYNQEFTIKILYDMVYNPYETESAIGKSLFGKSVTHSIPKNFVCGGALTLLGDFTSNPPTFGFELQGKTFELENGVMSKTFQELCIEIIVNMEKSGCNIQGIQLAVRSTFIDNNGMSRLESHFNLLIIIKDENGFTLALYDPHGTAKKSRYIMITDTFVNNFNYFFQNFCSVPLTLIPRKAISCPIGAQVYSDDNVGYCTTFGLFWYYCFLMIIKDIHVDLLSSEVFRYIIERLETVILLIFSREELLHSIYVFSNMWTERVYLNKHRAFRASRSNIHSDYNFIQDRLTHHLRNPIFATPTRNTYTQRNVSFRKRAKVHDKIVQFSDGEDCKNNYDCKSGNCCSDICMPISYDVTPCDKDCECASGECKNNLCVVPTTPQRPTTQKRKGKIESLFSSLGI